MKLLYYKYMRRKIYQELLDWKQCSNGKSALLIEGARRVGKSYSVKEFAEREYKSYVLIWRKTQAGA